MSEQQFEDFLKRNAADYNAPPSAAPRDEMWAAISEARAARRLANPPAGGTPVLPIASRRPIRRYAPWIGMAATLLVGIGIGRFFMKAPTNTQLAQQVTAPTPEVPNNDRESATEPEIAAPSVAAPQAGIAQLAAAAPTRRLPAATPAYGNDVGSSPFALASREHLQRAEALVSVVAATPADAFMDSLTGKWAREMLMNTRLLLDSPAGDDPARRQLLEDLETVLVQLVQRSGADADERALIGRTLERTQLLTRLRNGAAGL